MILQGSGFLPGRWCNSDPRKKPCDLLLQSSHCLEDCCENAQKQIAIFVNFVNTYRMTDAILNNVKTPQYII